MSNPYIGEIRMFGGNFAPAGWHFCDGSTMPISENDALFTLLGTTYGGDGQETFGLPDLRGRVPIHQGQGGGLQNYQIGESAGTETVTLTTNQIPLHSHALIGSADIGTDPAPSNDVLATSTIVKPYVGVAPDATMPQATITPSGGSQPHENTMPFLCVNFIISLYGRFPTQS